MNRIRTSTLIVALTLLAIPLFMAAECQITGSFRTFDTTGEVVNAREQSEPPVGVDDVDITLTSLDDKTTYTGRTNSDGEFDVRNVESGSYTLTAEKDGWFIPERIVNIGEQAQGISEIPAFKLNPDDQYGISFILMWNDNVEDVDIHMSFPTDWGDSSFQTPYETHLEKDPRARVYWDSKTYSYNSSTVVYMDRDDRSKIGPETLTLRDIPHGDGTNTSAMSATEGDPNGLYTAFSGESGFSDSLTFGWLGSAVVYLNAFSDGSDLSSGDSDSAEAKIYVFQTLPESGVSKVSDNTDLTAEYLGLYRVPEFTTLKSARMIRLNMLQDSTPEGYIWYQIVPEIEVIPEGPEYDNKATFQSAAGNNGIIGVRGGKRSSR